MFEARQIVAAARKYNRMVQQGSQSRSNTALQEAVQKMKRRPDRRRVSCARPVLQMARHHRHASPSKPVPAASITISGWVPRLSAPFTRNRFHYNWHWNWDYGNGDIGNQGIHEMDIARWGLGVKYPDQGLGHRRALHVRRRSGNAQHLDCAFEFDEGGKKKMMSSRCATG